MLDRKKEVLDAEKNVNDFLQARPAAIDTELASTDAAVKASRAGAGDDIKSVLESVGQRYNVAPEALASANPALQRINEDLAAAHQDAQAFKKVKLNQAKVNTTFNFAFQRLASAGMDAKLARQVAMQFAMDTQRREAESTANEKSRKVTMEKQEIVNAAQDQKIEMARKAAEARRKNAIFNSVVRSFTGLAGMGVGGLITKSAMKAGGAMAGEAAAGAIADYSMPITQYQRNEAANAGSESLSHDDLT